MQTDNSLESFATLRHLVETGDYEFELRLDELQLHPILFGSRFNFNFSHEEDYHSFVGEIACDR